MSVLNVCYALANYAHNLSYYAMLAMLVKLSYYAHNYAHNMQRCRLVSISYIEQHTDIVKYERQLANMVVIVRNVVGIVFTIKT